MVLALEHADGTAAACHLAGGRGWKYYSGWGSEAERACQTQCAPYTWPTGFPCSQQSHKFLRFGFLLFMHGRQTPHLTSLQAVYRSGTLHVAPAWHGYSHIRGRLPRIISLVFRGWLYKAANWNSAKRRRS